MKRNQPAARNVKPVDLADGRTHEQAARDFDRRIEAIEAVYQVWNPATQEWESERPSTWDLWARGWGT